MHFAKLHTNPECVTVASTVQNWINIMLELSYPETLLTMDSYYIDNTSKKLLHDHDIKYIAGFAAGRFVSIESFCVPKVEKEGDHYSIIHETTGYSVTYYCCPNKKLGKRWEMSNACELQVSSSVTENVPLFDLYRATFSVCDYFNRSLHDCTWPHKTSGKNSSGSKRKQNDFILSCILHNTSSVFATSTVYLERTSIFEHPVKF